MCKLPVESEGAYFTVDSSGGFTFHVPGESLADHRRFYAGNIHNPHEDIPAKALDKLVSQYYMLR